MSSERELTDYLHRHIPLSETMGVEVMAASPQHIKLWARFAPNVNHQCTVFGVKCFRSCHFGSMDTGARAMERCRFSF